MANIFWFWTKHDSNDIDNGAKASETPKISWTLVHKQHKIGPEFLPTVSILFRPQSVTHAVGGISVASHGESKWNGIGFVCSSDLKPQNDFSLAMALRLAALMHR